LHDDAREGRRGGRPHEARSLELVDAHTHHTWRNREVEDAIPGNAATRLDLIEALCERGVGRRIGKAAAHEEKIAGKVLEGIGIERAPRVLLDALAGERAEALVVELCAREADHREVRGQYAVAHQIVETRQKLASR